MIRRRPRRVNKCKLYTRWYKCAQRRGAISVGLGGIRGNMVTFNPSALGSGGLLPYQPSVQILKPEVFCNPPTPSSGGGIVIGIGVANSLAHYFSFNTLKSYAKYLRCPPRPSTTPITPHGGGSTAQFCTLYTQAFQCLIQKGWLTSISFPNGLFTPPTGNPRQFTVPEAWCSEMARGVHKQRHQQMMLELGSIRQWCKMGGQPSHGAPVLGCEDPNALNYYRGVTPSGSGCDGNGGTQCCVMPTSAPPRAKMRGARGGNWTVRPDGTKIDRRGRPITKATHHIVGGTCYGCGDCGGVDGEDCLDCDHGTEKCLSGASVVALKHQAQMRKGRGGSIGRGLSQSNMRARYGGGFRG